MIELRHLTKLFGRKEAVALAMAEHGAGKAEILTATGCTLALRTPCAPIASGSTRASSSKLNPSPCNKE